MSYRSCNEVGSRWERKGEMKSDEEEICTWQSSGGKEVRFVNIEAPYFEAKAYCEKNGGEMLALKSVQAMREAWLNTRFNKCNMFAGFVNLPNNGEGEWSDSSPYVPEQNILFMEQWNSSMCEVAFLQQVMGQLWSFDCQMLGTFACVDSNEGLYDPFITQSTVTEPARVEKPRQQFTNWYDSYTFKIMFVVGVFALVVLIVFWGSCRNKHGDNVNENAQKGSEKSENKEGESVINIDGAE